MNERIQELFEQSRTGYGLGYDMEKFAELIIKECADVAADHDAFDIYEEIREHFGVV